MRFLTFLAWTFATSLSLLVFYNLIRESSGSAASGLNLSSDRFLLKQVPVGEVSDAVIWLRNDSREPIQLSSVTASCGCTSVDVSQQILSPGEVSPVTVRVTGRLDMPIGTIGTVTISLNGKIGPLVLPVVVETVTGIWVSPVILDLGSVPVSRLEPLVGEFHVLHRRDRVSSTPQVVCTSPAESVSVQVMGHLRTGQESICRVIVDPQAFRATGVFVSSIAIEARNDQGAVSGRFTLPIRVTVR